IALQQAADGYGGLIAQRAGELVRGEVIQKGIQDALGERRLVGVAQLGIGHVQATAEAVIAALAFGREVATDIDEVGEVELNLLGQLAFEGEIEAVVDGWLEILLGPAGAVAEVGVASIGLTYWQDQRIGGWEGIAEPGWRLAF